MRASDRYPGWLVLGTIALAACAGSATDRPPEAAAVSDHGDGRTRLELVADFNLAHGSVPPVGPAAARFGGISGLIWNPAGREFLAVTDDHDSRRIFRISLTVEPRFQAEVHGVLELAPAAAPGEPQRLYDLEAIALDDERLFIATEGRVDELPRIPPAVAEYTLTGELRRILPLPPGLAAEPSGPATVGVRDNLGFESLTLTPDATRLIAAPESALVQDGLPAALDHGAPVRLVIWSLESAAPGLAAQYVYPLEPIPDPGFAVGFGDNGLAELLVLEDGELLALERAYLQRQDGSDGVNVVRLFSVSLAGATDVSGRLSLADGPEIVPVEKRLVLDLDDVVERLDPRFPGLDNFEGMALGPPLEDGSPTLILVSDDNFNPAQRNAFLLFRIVQNR